MNACSQKWRTCCLRQFTALLLGLSCCAFAAAQSPSPVVTKTKPASPSATVTPSPRTEAFRAELPRRSYVVSPPAYAGPIDRLEVTPLPYDSELPPAVQYIRPYPTEAYEDWTPQWLPEGLIYRSYLGGVKESRMASVFNYQDHWGMMWDITLGGRAGLFRFGTLNGLRPEGFQIDIEGSGQPRLDLNNNEDLVAADFRAGLPVTYGIGPWQSKFAYYHLSSHIGDEYFLAHPTFQRINYSRDVLVLGQSYYLTDALRLYAEAGWAFYSDVSKPWEFQFGIDYSPLSEPGLRGAPFFALNGQLRQELNYGGNFVAQIGRQWRGGDGGQLFRIGLQYYNGKSNEFELYDQFEHKLGLGLWYDY